MISNQPAPYINGYDPLTREPTYTTPKKKTYCTKNDYHPTWFLIEEEWSTI